MQAKPLPSRPEVVKAVLTPAAGWQTPRPPNIVTFRWAVEPTAVLCAGASASTSASPPLTEATHAMGAGTLPEGLECALNSMPVGEAARFVVPVELLAGEGGHGPWAEVPGTAGHATVLLTVELMAVEEIRDMTGDGRVRSPATRPGCRGLRVCLARSDSVAT